MVRMTNMVEARSTPSYGPSMASPRYGACVTAFLHFFDWTPATKRLSGHNPEKPLRRPRSFRGGHGSTGKIPRMCQSVGNGVLDPGGSTRAPGVVARLMGLESLPQPQSHFRDEPPILLQDLLKRDYKASKKKKSTLRERIPAIFTAREETSRRRMRRKQKKSNSVSLLTAFRCRPEVSPAYIPATTSRFLYSVARSPRSPFLSRLGSHTPLESPACGPSSNYRLLHEKIPELSLQASSTGTTMLLQGWPLGSQHIVPPDIFQEDTFEPPPPVSTSSLTRPSSSLTRPTSDNSASSKPLMAIGSYKVVQGKRRGSSWNGSEGSESTVEQEVHPKPPRVGRRAPSPPSDENARHRRPATTKNTKTSQESMSTASKVKKKKKVKSKEEMALKKSPPKVRNPKRGVSSTPPSSSSSKASMKGDHVSTKIGGEVTLKRRNKFLHKHGRARSVDDVFPELPFELEIAKLMHHSDQFGEDIDFYRECGQISSSPLVDFASGACLLGRLSDDSLVDDYELGSWGVGDFGSKEESSGQIQISTSPLIDCDELRSLGEKANDQELCETRFGEVDDEEVLETVERSCSGPSVSSESLLSDVDDDRNGESWSSYHNLEDCHPPLKLFEIPEIDVEPREHQSSPPAQFVKKVVDPLVDEAGQPSPVSILNSPFHDEACTTPESSITESIHRQANCKDQIVDELDLPPTSVSNGDKIRQALLAISMFRTQEEENLATCPRFEGKSVMAMDYDTKDERSFIRGVLSAARFMCTPGSSPDWHDRDVVIDPSLFEKLESGDIVEFKCQAGGGLWRCDRKLLFDSVNQAFGLTRFLHCQGTEGWQQEELVWRSARPRGELSVTEVVKKIEEWRTLASYAIDSLIEKDMSVHAWRSFGPEVAEVGLEIENRMWGDILEEVVVDMIMPNSKP